MQLRAEIDVSFSDHRDELEISKEQCQRLLKQNGALLEQLADLESEMEARFGGFSGITGALQKESNRNSDKVIIFTFTFFISSSICIQFQIVR